MLSVPAGDDDGAGVDAYRAPVAVRVLDPGCLAVLDHDALDVRPGAQLELPGAQASWM